MSRKEDFGDQLIEALQEAVAYQRGELENARVDRVELTARTTRVVPPPRYDADRIRSIRRRLGVSQPVFAGLLNVSGGTVRAWEQGLRDPDGPSLRLLEVAESHPAALLAHVVGVEG
ncbi:MAG: helix-turn-helix domain-containing protein [Gemmatimonadetes bacterium]|nr:helix-turn-helix domain-containing protein [Gemmatimonadota bacterium]